MSEQNESESSLKEIAAVLHELQRSVGAIRGEGNSAIHAHGWLAPAVTLWDLEKAAELLAEQVESELPFTEDEDARQLLEDWPTSLRALMSQTVPQLATTNAATAASVYISSISALRIALYSVLGWSDVRDKGKMPAALRRRIKNTELILNSIIPDADKLKEQVQRISQAADAADDLPVTLVELERARAQAAIDADNAQSRSLQASAALESTQSVLAKIEAAATEATALVEKVREAHRITTSVGLAAAFDERAKRLGRTLFYWVIVLIGSLLTGAALSAVRWSALTKLAEGTPNWPAVGLQIFLSVVSLGGPIWLAWMATKQIGERFKLSEDYAFKASVAKAYEGYRREAEAIADEGMATRLFESALTRLEEAPLRFVEQESHGSPWNDFASSPAFQEAMNKIPGFLESYKALLPSGMRLPFKRNNQAEPASAAAASPVTDPSDGTATS
ncbi:hypothetical protein [Xanthomonas arboricola]|uniref:hypothetical protein n=1 Tax=Xanthomonas arboricola TaxID=56448 RepID=UPI0032E885A7